MLQFVINGWNFSISWCREDVAFCVTNRAAQADIVISMPVWKQIVKTYGGWVRSGIWEGKEQKHEMAFFSSSSGRWQFCADTHFHYEKSIRRRHSLLIRHEASSLGEQHAVMFITQREFDQILKWFKKQSLKPPQKRKKAAYLKKRKKAA